MPPLRRQLVSRSNREQFERKDVSPARKAALGMMVQGLNPKAPGMDAYLEDARRRGEISPLDAGLAQEIAFGVCRHRRWLEHILGKFLLHPLPEKAFHVHEALLIGIYQALFLDRIPAHTIVDETVKLVASARTEASYRGLANAIMRKVVSEDRAALVPKGDEPWMVRLSVPEWLASEAGQIYRAGELVEFFAASNQSTPMHLRAVPLNNGEPIDLDALEERLRGEIVDQTHQVPDIDRGRFLRDCFIVSGRGVAPDFLPSFRRGLVTAEDEGAQIVAHLAGAAPDMAILDLCASPGGKTSHLADCARRRFGRFVASDASDHKLHRLRDTLGRLGLVARIETRLASTITTETEREAFDLVLVDAPCSGLGTLRRHPEIRWRRSTKDIRALAKIQGGLLDQAAPLVKPGGVLTYSVCTFTLAETEGVVRRFLDAHREFQLTGAPEGLPFDEEPLRSGHGRWRTAPHKHGCDAFFVARFQRMA